MEPILESTTESEGKMEQAKKNSHLRKLSLIFNLEDPQDQQRWHQLEASMAILQQSLGKKVITKSALLKTFIHTLTPKEILSLHKEFLGPEQKLQLWCSSYNQIHHTKFSVSEFAVTIMPTLREKDYLDLEKNALSFNPQQEVQNVTTA